MSLEQHESEEVPDSHTPSGKSPWRLIFAVIAVLAIAGYITWRIHTNHEETAETAKKITASASRPIPVLVAEVQKRKMPIYLTALGTVTANNTVTIKSRVDGELRKVNFREGQQVKRGALLLQIDPAPYQAAFELAQGQYIKDQASVTVSKAESSRYASLYDAGVVSQESQQNQESLYGQAQGALKADLAAIHAAKVNLDYTHITSPIDGQVGLRQVDVGNIVRAADANGLVVVTQLQPISVIFTVPEDQLPLVRKKLLSKEPLVVEAYDRSMTTKLATGTLLTIDNQIDATTGMDKLKATFPNKDSALFPNQFVNVRLILEERPDVLVIPAAAMQMGNTGNFVYVVKADNTVEPLPIPGAIMQGSQLLLDNSVRPGDKIVIDGQEKIHAGSKIVISKAGAGKGDAGAKAEVGAKSSEGTKPTTPTDAGADAKHGGKGVKKTSNITPGAAQ